MTACSQKTSIFRHLLNLKMKESTLDGKIHRWPLIMRMTKTLKTIKIKKMLTVALMRIKQRVEMMTQIINRERLRQQIAHKTNKTVALQI